MNDVIDTITGASIIALLSVGCTAVKQSEPIQPQVQTRTIEQFFSPPPIGVPNQATQAKTQPPNWPPHLHTTPSDETFPPPLEFWILQEDKTITF